MVESCISCGKAAPATETNYTLISAKFGWRLTRSPGADGTISLAWRCPTCWHEWKRSRAVDPAAAPDPLRDGAAQAAGAPAALRGKTDTSAAKRPKKKPSS